MVTPDAIRGSQVPGGRTDDGRPEESVPSSGRERSAQNVLDRFYFQCPQCKRELLEYAESCPHCGAGLLNVFSATYQPTASTTKKLVAWAILIFFVGTMAAAFLMVVRF